MLSSSACLAQDSPDPDAPPPAASSMHVAVAKGRLTVDVHDVPLDEVLHAVGDKAGIDIEISGDVAASITKSFADVPLEDGIRELLRGQSYTLSYGAAGWSDGIAIAVFDRARVEAPGAKPSVPAAADWQQRLRSVRALSRRRDAAAVNELKRLAASDPNSVVRSQAVAALARLGTDQALAPLTQAAADQAAAVRIQALRGLRFIQGPTAIPQLQAAMGYDPDPSVRRQAVLLLSELQSPEVPFLLKQAATDPDRNVSREAARAAAQWERRNGAAPGTR